MERITKRQNLSLTDALSTTPAMRFEGMAGGLIYIPSGSSITSLTWYASYDGETFIAAYDSSGVAVTQTVAADQCHPIPDSLFAADHLKIVVNAAGDVVAQFKS